MKHLRRRLLAVAAIVAAGPLVLASCSSTSASQPQQSSTPAARISVVASTDVYGDIAATIGGDAVTVTSIIDRPDVDPHSYQASVSTQLALSRADVVIENGGGYDDFVDTMLRAAKNPGVTVLNAVKISGHEAPPGGELNEHVWYDVTSVRALVAKLADELSRRDPAGADAFAQHAQTFDAGLSKLAGTEAALAKRYRGTKVAITEPVPLYLLQACGLENVTPPDFTEAVEEGTDVAPRVLARTLALFDRAKPGVAILVENVQTDDPATQRVRAAATAADIPVVPVTETLPAGTDYLAWMTANLHAVRTALAS